MERGNKIQFRHLAWDSDFFGRKIGSIRAVAPCESERLRCAIEEAAGAEYELLYLILDGDKEQLSQLDLGCEHLRVDVKYTFGCELNREPKAEDATRSEGVEISRYTGPAERLFELAYQAGEHSRYRLDPHFAKGEFERFYRTWIINSLAGSMADHIFVAGDPLHPLGFVTLKSSSEEASIGLIAVDTSTRGQGVGGRLVARALEQAAADGCRRLSVATQKDNLSACNFYRRCGLSLVEWSTIYHCWLQSPKQTR